MNDRASQLITVALDDLSTASAAGHSQASPPSSGDGAFPALLGLQPAPDCRAASDATRVAGFALGSRWGAKFDEAEKGIAILAPLLRRATVVEDDDGADAVGSALQDGVLYSTSSQTTANRWPISPVHQANPGRPSTLEQFLAIKASACLNVESVPGSPSALGATTVAALLSGGPAAAELLTTSSTRRARASAPRRCVAGSRTSSANSRRCGRLCRARRLDSAPSSHARLHPPAPGIGGLLAASLGRIRERRRATDVVGLQRPLARLGREVVPTVSTRRRHVGVRTVGFNVLERNGA